MKPRTVSSLAALILVAASPVLLASPAEAAVPRAYKNCTQLNKTYPHGVGKPKAVDRTSGKRVTNFKRSAKIYAKAMSHNRGLDRDKDGIACEKR